MKTCKELAAEWGIAERTIVNMCKTGKIQGAMKVGKQWQIPDDAKRPVDGRIVTGKYIKITSREDKKSLPVGISEYVRAQSEYYYVDKTLLIKEFLDNKPMVSLFTRPRRFGKTLNMDMLRVFFELSDQDTSAYFKDKAIWKCGEKYTKHQGKYPVIFLTFKDVKYESWEATLSKIAALLRIEFGRHSELENSPKLPAFEKEYYKKVINGNPTEVDLSSALENLSRMLYFHHGVKPIIIIDEYDTPIQEGYSQNFYDEIIGFMRNFFSGGFKDNKNLSYGFLTGILRIAQESIFSGLNNLSVNTILNEKYDNFFGFTYPEIKQLLSYYGVLDKKEELKEWYDGYRFGNEEIYNPWSVINYVANQCLPQAYWVNTGRNEIIADVIRIASEDIVEKLYSLLQGEIVIAKIEQNTVYRVLTDDPANIYSLLMVAGYLKANKKTLQDDGSFLCEVAIPNKEIAAVYKTEILSYLMEVGAITNATANKIAESLYSNDTAKLQKAISEYMMKSMSFYDAGAEGFYHGLFLGLIVLMDNQYKIRSNRESGDGRYDVSMFPKKKELPGIIIEVKWDNDLDDKALDKLAEKALEQIDDKNYETEMRDDGITDIIKFGMAFSGKHVLIKTR
ncbi:AAA family ATPase [Butyrivibrio sp. YAB3001]|uniref:AAA family ATPase n=1 Tax=Butyrivibrio sp. YAB3001 TaxID=1520812 RepID=UPI0008F64CB1|nr:AAA family ATPase [Butyrivibrio sp. YAB3001]SFC28145.1 PD-(D/E)XK nuclease superfamily protein [Butyrivibrio sp. YAB3001]